MRYHGWDRVERAIMSGTEQEEFWAGEFGGSYIVVVP